MDITLTHLLVVIAVFSLIAITLIALLKNKVTQLESAFKQQSVVHSEALTALEATLSANLTALHKQNIQHQIQQKDVLQDLINEMGKHITKQLQNIREENQTKLNEVQTSITDNVKALEKEQKTIAFKNQQDNLSNLEQLSSFVNTLRINNLIELTNALAKHQALSVETEDFIKVLGDCKVLTLKDKHSGQTTEIHYENGIKVSSDTFADDTLKYQMFYSESGNAEKGVELDANGNIIFEYLYDDAGEISKKIESEYDQAGNKINQKEKIY